ncbi:hypothetical protein PIB30_076722 [Stylosanthes scabra]|uniref:Ubiquitin-like protease family profile domain-containing protein n=1 Tax=Stylosanthes scabra TaxID=79078 RepID=A0ABU6UU27_9FABA|nr:hypothetical protein [Stylosanthes scabra]
MLFSLTVKDIVAEAQQMEKQEREAAPTLNKIGQHAPGPKMTASVASEAEEYEPSKAFDLGLTPEEPENIVTPGVPATVITAYSLVLNNEPIPRFQNKSKVIGHFKEDFIDNKTKKIFAPVLYSDHWWMYVLDKDKKNFFVIDSRPRKNQD